MSQGLEVCNTKDERGLRDDPDLSLPMVMVREKEGRKISLDMVFFLVAFTLLLYGALTSLRILGFLVIFFLPFLIILIGVLIGTFLYDRDKEVVFDGSSVKLVLTDGRIQEMQLNRTLRVDVALEYGHDSKTSKHPPKDWSTGAPGDIAFRIHGPLSGIILDQDGQRFFVSEPHGFKLVDIRTLWDHLMTSLDVQKARFSKDAVRYLKMRHLNGQDDGFTKEELNTFRAYPPIYWEPITLGEALFLPFGICVPVGFALIMIYWEKGFWVTWLMISLPIVLGLSTAELVWRYRKHAKAIEKAG